MKRSGTRLLICTLLLIALTAGTLVASAAQSTVMILETTVDDGRLRDGPSSSYNVLRTLSKGEKVFFTGQTSAAFCLVRTAKGEVGYIYRGFLTNYGIVRMDQIYYALGTVNVYKRPSTDASRAGTLGAGEHVLVFLTSGDWAFIKTMNGGSGFARLSELSSFI